MSNIMEMPNSRINGNTDVIKARFKDGEQLGNYGYLTVKTFLELSYEGRTIDKGEFLQDYTLADAWEDYDTPIEMYDGQWRLDDDEIDELLELSYNEWADGSGELLADQIFNSDLLEVTR